MKARGTGRIYARRRGPAPASGQPDRRRVSWWIEYWYRGVQHRESVDMALRKRGSSSKDAADLLKDRLAQMGQGRRVIGQDAERLTIQDLLDMVRDDYILQARKSVPPFTRLLEFFDAEDRAIDVTPDRARAYHRFRNQQSAAAATIRNELATLGRGLTLAFEAGKLHQRPRLPMPRVVNARSGFFTDRDVAAVLRHLPPHMRPLVESAYYTGWRRAELCELRWSQVDWGAGVLRLERGTTKSGEPRSFPFVAHSRLEEILRERLRASAALERETGHQVETVFAHPDGRPLRGWYYHAWRKACEDAGLAGRLFHDLRRSAVRNLVRAGVSERVAMSLTGHKTRSVFDRYHIVAGSDQVDAVRKLASLQTMVDDSPRRRSRTFPAPRSDSKRLSDAQLAALQQRSVASPTGFEPVLPP